MFVENNNIKINTDLDNANIYLKTLLKDGVTIPVDEDVDKYEIHLPPWYNETLFKRAQKYYHKYQWSMFVGKLCGLIAILSIPTIHDILEYTKQSASPKLAFRRYVRTVFHTLNWYKQDLKPETNSWKSLAAVRKKHVRSSRYCEKNKIGFITQRDMAFTQFGFIGFIILKNHLIGIHQSDEEIEAFIHFWRVIGYMLGIEDRFNICTSSVKETKLRLEVIRNEVLKPALQKSPQNFYQMADIVITGLWCFNPMLNTEAFLYFTKRLTSVDGYFFFETEIEKENIKPISFVQENKEITNNNNNNNNINNKKVKQNHSFYSTLGMTSKIILCVTIYIQQILYKLFIFRWYFNAQIILSFFLIKYFPFLAFYKFGVRESYVRILKGESLT